MHSSGHLVSVTGQLSSVVDLVMLSLLLMACCFGERANLGEIWNGGFTKNHLAYHLYICP